MSYAQLLSALQKLTAADLERPARVMVCNQALAIRAVVDEDTGLMLDSGVLAVSLDTVEE